MRRTPLLVLVAIALAASTPSAATAADWPACTPRTAPVQLGLRETARHAEGRLLTLTLRSTALGAQQRVNVLLPPGYDPSASTRYPVLYLLHGAQDDYAAWAAHGAADIVGERRLIVVMPDGGHDGSYSDWLASDDPPNPAGGQPGGAPAWESYHLGELVPFVDAHFRTTATPGGRAVAGLSMGGHGAMKYADEAPGTFGYAGSFSGAVHPGLPIYTQFIKQCTWGDPATQGVVWHDNDPTETAGNLRGTRLFVRSGDGTPGPLDPPGSAGPDVVETVVGQMNQALMAALKAAGVTGVDAAFGHGTHTWPYWQRDLRDYLTWLDGQLKRPVTAPARFSVESAHTAFTAWGWRLRTHRAAREVTYLRDVRSTGLTVTGSGRLDVVTPPRYRAGGRYAVRAGARTRTVRADRTGRLSFAVDLGPGHTTQQAAFGASATRGWKTAAVRIGKVR
jgi:diacylglycerol O-acyltransferase/trehalose O-mycolyltransferase